MDTSEPVEVYSGFNPAEVEIIKNMLEAEGIQAKVTGENQGVQLRIAPEVTIMVHIKDADRARKLIRAHQEAAAKDTSDTNS